MEFLQTYGLWILLAVGAVWFFARRGGHGMGCGMGGHGGHPSHEGDRRPAGDSPSHEAGTHAGHDVEGRGGAGPPRPRRPGCC